MELATKKATERMQGAWQLKALNREGDSEPLKGITANMQIVVEGDRRTVQAGKAVYTQAYYAIDPYAQPPAIDVIVTGGSMRGQTLLGIYSIEGDRMRVCLASAGRDRPRDFNPRAGSGQTLQELERVSP